MKVQYTSQDGWNVYSPTADAIRGCVSALNEHRSLCTEVSSCVRMTDVETIKEDMLELAETLKTYAERIDEEVQFITIGNEDLNRYFRYLNEYLDIDELCEKEKMSTQQAINWVRAMQKVYKVEDIAER